MTSLNSRVGNLMGRALNKTHATVYRRSDGRVWGTMFGGPVLLLNTTGRKSGHLRTNPLLYIKDGEDFVLIASNGGASSHPAWYLNLRANPVATVEVGERKVRVRAEEVDGEEKARLWQKMVAMYSSYDDYQEKTDREIPLLVLHPSDWQRGPS
jgi:deazaflavin-dependent oxidoreductase (nitroreductase family)